jgi:carbon monoxide dehydrogenase subunit G
MDIEGSFAFDLPQETVWEVLRDPRALASIIPMVRDIKQVSEDQYTGVLFFKAGSVAGTFQGKIDLFNIQEPDSYEIAVQGGSPVGQVQIAGGMRLEVQGDQTIMFYHGKFNFGGRIASVGSRLLEIAVRSTVQQSFETLNRYLNVKYKNK